MPKQGETRIDQQGNCQVFQVFDVSWQTVMIICSGGDTDDAAGFDIAPSGDDTGIQNTPFATPTPTVSNPDPIPVPGPSPVVHNIDVVEGLRMVDQKNERLKTTGPLKPNNVDQLDVVSSNSWINKFNVDRDDDQHAVISADSAEDSTRLIARDFKANVPSGAKVAGIKATVERSSNVSVTDDTGELILTKWWSILSIIIPGFDGVYVSKDGLSWPTETIPAVGTGIVQIARNSATNTLCAIAKNDDLIRYDKTGDDWTDITAITAAFNIAYGDDTWVCFTTNNPIKYRTSVNDGVAWSAESTITSSSVPNSAGYFNGEFVILDSSHIWTSTDATSWVDRAPAGASFGAGNVIPMFSDGSNTIAIDENGKIHKSTASGDWDVVSNDLDMNTIQGADYHDGKYVVSGFDNTSGNADVAYSDDMAIWNRANLEFINASFADITSLIYSFTLQKWLFVNTGGSTTEIWVSEDGEVWQFLSDGHSFSAGQIIESEIH